MRYKDIWFREMEQNLNERLDRGEDFDTAYEKASQHAEKSAPERLRDMADLAKKKERGE